MSQTNQYIRQVLHHTEPPPPIEARFFYTSSIPIDDPLSPLPPPATGAVVSKKPPKPFSKYDNTSLDKAWHELRRKILKYNEEHGEKTGSHEGSRTRKSSDDVRTSKRLSGSDQSTPRAKPTRPAASSLSQVDGPPADLETSLDMLDGPALGPDAVSHETTGTPFVRAPSRRKLNTLPVQRGKDQKQRPKTLRARDTYDWDDDTHLLEHSPAPEQRKQVRGPTNKVAVGVSRLHQVEMPDLKMTPIYWTPIHDTAAVTRGTWFYQDTMLPVETPVANMLEAGYIDLQVWTDTWKDELNSAVEVGAVGEMKIVHKLWPEKVHKQASGRLRADSSSSRPSTANRENLLRTVATNLAENEPETPEQHRERSIEAACDIIDISTGPGGADNKASGISTWGRQGPVRTYATCGVIYSNDTEARILKPSLLPSAYYGRRPLANYIRKGYKLGVAVVRGFDQAIWDKLYPAKGGSAASKAEAGVSSSASGAPPTTRRKTDPDLAKSERPKVTDLIFVIHGIGQKLSQRMESFHFTHAISAFRREVNVEAGTKEVKARFRKGMGGIMVLPINWRHSLSFEEGGYQDDEDPALNHFGLPDITPDTLPSIRNIVSDVMLDIPYYMSHHQPKMIAAVVREANRVYQLWCLNNPGFAEQGRVHIIAHSLGSVMSVDILSKQPTTIPRHLSDPNSIDLGAEQMEHFLFNTSNLYLAGSPTGFFLLLKKAQLLPRIDTEKIDDLGSASTAVCGEQGQYGCIAVENVYNIMNPYDPVSYHLNAAVDAAYAASLKKAIIPSLSAGWFGTSWFAGSGTPSKPTAPPLPRLPSNVEMETHNFSREEIAEKRMYLLNDNGQIDFFLRYGGGPLEIQYLTMLGAHSSYWLLRDFVWTIVVETGRERGRSGTVIGMRAVKKKVQLA